MPSKRATEPSSYNYNYEDFPVGTKVIPDAAGGWIEGLAHIPHELTIVERPPGREQTSCIWGKDSGGYIWYFSPNRWPVHKKALYSCFDCGATFEKLHFLCPKCEERALYGC